MNLTVIPAGVLLVLCCVAVDHLPFGDSVTVFRVQCAGVAEDGRCPASEGTARPVTFRAFPDLQRVIYWSDQNAPKRLHHCAVRNARNWSCAADDGSNNVADHSWQMVGGRFHEVSDNAAVDSRIQVSRWHWWWVRLQERA